MARQSQADHRWLIPQTWRWLSLSSVAEITIGRKAAKAGLARPEGTIPLILPEDLENKPTIEYRRRVTEKVYQRFLPKGTGTAQGDKAPKGKRLLVALAAGERTSNLAIFDGEQAVLDRSLAELRPSDFIVLDFLFYYFSMKEIKAFLRNTFSVVTPGLHQRLSELEVPVPPENVQARIVERIEALTHDVREGVKRISNTETNAVDALERALADTFAPQRTATWQHRRRLGQLLRRNTERKYTQQAEYAHSPYIEASALERTGQLRPSNPVAFYHFTDRKHRYVIEHAPDTIFYATVPSSGARVAMPSLEQAVCAPDVVPLVVTTTERLLPRFFFWSLIAQPIAQHFTVPETVTHKAGSIEYVQMPYPDRDEQSHIVSHLDDIQRSILRIQTLLLQDREHMKQVEERILTKAFRGEL